jgi:hypothetical protein
VGSLRTQERVPGDRGRWCLSVEVPVGTLNQGYPLLQYEDTVPARLSLVAR